MKMGKQNYILETGYEIHYKNISFLEHDTSSVGQDSKKKKKKQKPEIFVFAQYSEDAV